MDLELSAGSRNTFLVSASSAWIFLASALAGQVKLKDEQLEIQLDPLLDRDEKGSNANTLSDLIKKRAAATEV